MTSVNGATQGTGSSKNKRKAVGVVLFNGEQLVIHVDVKGKLYEVFNQVAAHLSLRETEYFGLAVVRDEEYQFLILDEKISKVAPKKWKTGPGEGYDIEGRPLFTVWFRVQFYVDQVVLLREKVTRHLYYLQLKENVLKYNHLYNEEKCFQIVGYALQADCGNFIADKHIADYFDPRLYFPAWMAEKRGSVYLSLNCPLIHQDMHNVTRTDAQLKYVRECSTPPGAHNLHFYRVRKKKTDKACNTWLAICPRGVEVYEDDAGFKNLISTFLWPDIGRLVFDKKKFEIRSVGSAGGRRFAYYTDSDVTSKYLLHICRSTHMFQMAIQPKLMEIRHLDAEDKKRYRESYIYSDTRDLHANGGPVQYRSNKSPGKSSAGTQRYSVISDVSSNTTSGIVSDKMAISFDEGEEAGREIVIDCPPRQSSLHGMPSQAHTKVPLRGSYKMTPPTPDCHSPALPPQSLELFRSHGSTGKGSPASTQLQELSPPSSGGSYRAKFQQTSHTLYTSMGKTYTLPTPSPSSPGQPFSILNSSPSSPPHHEKELASVGRSASRKESLKGGGVLMNVERNVSGDSTTTSGSTASTGVVALSVESSPITPPAHTGPGVPLTPPAHVGVPIPQYPNSSVVTGSPSYSYSPASFSQTLPPPTVVGGGLMYPVDSAVVAPSSSQPGAMMLPPMMARLGLSSTSPPVHPLSSPHTPPTMLEHLYTDRSNNNEPRVEDVQEILAPPPAFADAIMMSERVGGGGVGQDHQAIMMSERVGGGGVGGGVGLDHQAMVMSERVGGGGVGGGVGPDHQAIVMSERVGGGGVGPDHQAMVMSERVGGGGEGVDHHAHSFPSQSSSSQGSGAVHSGGSFSQGGSIDSGHVLSDESNSTQHSAQSSEEDSGMKDNYSDCSASRTSAPAGKRITPAKMKAGSRSKATHVSVKNQKEALHPDIEQILGQSQAQSLPLITALCNDLMTGSTHSSSGSYDTSTLRSSDSHPDSRRWSTCGPMETSVGAESGSSSTGTMLVVGTGTRPYSWHSEHFDLDSSLSVLPPGRKAVPKHPTPHGRHHPPRPSQVPESHRSFPHDLSRGGGGERVVWAQAVPHSAAVYGGSLDRSSPGLTARQLMIPSRLNSGGRSVAADSGTITHHPPLTHNIAIA
ncbi:hypothetical protein ACOMHN_034295 [Nucella lapillus]